LAAFRAPGRPRQLAIENGADLEDFERGGLRVPHAVGGPRVRTSLEEERPQRAPEIDGVSFAIDDENAVDQADGVSGVHE
jgi:hypothetical protein